MKHTERRNGLGGRVSVFARGLAVWLLLLSIVSASALDVAVDGPAASLPNSGVHAFDLCHAPGLVLTPLTIAPATATGRVFDPIATSTRWLPGHRVDHPPRSA